MQETKAITSRSFSPSRCAAFRTRQEKNEKKKTQGGKWGMYVEIQRREQTLLGSDPSTSSLIAVTVLEEALSEGRQHVFDPSRVAAPTRLNKTSCHYSEQQATAYIVQGALHEREQIRCFSYGVYVKKAAYVFGWRFLAIPFPICSLQLLF